MDDARFEAREHVREAAAHVAEAREALGRCGSASGDGAGPARGVWLSLDKIVDELADLLRSL